MSELPEKRNFIEKRPGNINYADERGSYPGCHLKFFPDSAGVNAFFAENANLLVVKLDATSDGLFVLYTNQLDSEDLEEFNEFSRAWMNHKQERDAAKAKTQAEKERSQKAAEDDVKALIELGKKCRDNHGKQTKQSTKTKVLDVEEAKALLGEALGIDVDAMYPGAKK